MADLNKMASSGFGKKIAAEYDMIASAASKAGTAMGSAKGRPGGGGGGGGAKPTVFENQQKSNPADMVRGKSGGAAPSGDGKPTTAPSTSTSTGIGAALTAAVSGGSGGGNGGGSSSRPANLSTGSPTSGDMAGANAVGGGVSSAIGNFMSNITGQNGLMGLLGAGLNGIAQLYGAIAGGGIQYTYNRINGPTGNQNMMLQLAQALAPNATMMSAATGQNMTMNKMIAGLSQRMPVMGTQQDMLQTILAGQGVGALMTGTPERNAFFESVRQMQVLNPGMSPGSSSNALAGYMRNIGSQQRGVFLGNGAFTMVGQGGRYKTLAEWAEGISKFFAQQRPGKGQGTELTEAELITQNFPGSNINAWFQMMGVPQDMVDYWWQYALTKKGGKGAKDITSDVLQGMVQDTRGINLGFERLRNTTQGTRREYLMGGQMYGMYAARESADRRFNVAMQGTDAAVAEQLRSTNIGRMLALLPTPIMEMLMPIMVQFATSPLGGAAAAVGGLMGDPPSPIGDPGGYGEAGGTGTAHLSPDLAKRVNAMLKANPKLKISSSYRDTVTQNRLRRNGHSMVGPAGKSLHTRGWAVDIGPVSEMGWLLQNSGKFGLQTAQAAGEPWHIQMAGTMPDTPPPYLSRIGAVGDPIGDPDDMPFGFGIPSLGDIAKSVGEGIFDMLAGILKPLMRAAMSPITNLISSFIGGGTYSSMIDTSTAMFSKLITAPLSGLVNLFGKADDDPKALEDLINQKASVKVPISSYAGFKSSGGGNNYGQIFGDPVSMLSRTPTTVNARIGAPIVFQADIKINGMGGSATEARRTAAVLVDSLEEEISRRKWLVS
jgi:hypothetical protein